MTPLEIIAGCHRGLDVTLGSVLYKQRLMGGLLNSRQVDQAYRQVYEMTYAAILSFADATVVELDYMDLLWGMAGGTGTLARRGEIVIPTPVAFTGAISSAGQDLEAAFTGDRSLEGLSDPARFEAWHNAFTSDMTIITSQGFWHADRMSDWWTGLADAERAQNRRLWNLWRRAVEGGRRQLLIGRACMADAAGFYWRLRGRGDVAATGRTATDFDEIYNYYQLEPEQFMVGHGGAWALDPSALSAGDAALRETCQYDIADTDPG